MVDFAVNYDTLQQVEKTLNSLKNEFNGIHTVPHAATWGDDRIGSAMGDFAGNWNDHRHKLLTSMEAMAKQARNTRTGTAEWDTQMAQQVTK